MLFKFTDYNGTFIRIFLNEDDIENLIIAADHNKGLSKNPKYMADYDNLSKRAFLIPEHEYSKLLETGLIADNQRSPGIANITEFGRKVLEQYAGEV